jgi:hypothetical protein
MGASKNATPLLQEIKMNTKKTTKTCREGENCEVRIKINKVSEAETIDTCCIKCLDYIQDGDLQTPLHKDS